MSQELPAEDEEEVPAHGDPPMALKSKSLSGAVSPSPAHPASHRRGEVTSQPVALRSSSFRLELSSSSTGKLEVPCLLHAQHTT
ncbi:hypothetical protein GUITHDRAFT_150267 [Guillardia theta CCMP2712]|uniref:Uncharacterized protein n=1 Tax=Guillardia theta (strain CCMP2712) TaxID=905079 RepID=L1K006_GUITC|nr:hypothetical protein GUITHDRAFT_150267 [Guillardia theta CCMP2712]EKX53703.1 hypothetical protein GUITHDRAFT_150267 [Guillardia theta CCMP2712]|eukprot:XP_005840683.1 hypothetical protein GUITHDRAFT_150267 [Guillardia theta CCMP2712]